MRPARSATVSVSITSSITLAYTSLSVALDHTVNIPPAHSALASPIARDPLTRATNAASNPPAAAVHAAENRFVASAVPTNGSASAHVRAIITYNGVPGSCGMPNVCTAAMNSPASHIVSPGATVPTYAAKSIAAAPTESRVAELSRGLGAADAPTWSAASRPR